MTDHGKLGQMHRPKVITKEDVREALTEEESVYGAAKALDIARATVYDYMKRYEWPNPRTGKIPGESE